MQWMGIVITRLTGEGVRPGARIVSQPRPTVRVLCSEKSPDGDSAGPRPKALSYLAQSVTASILLPSGSNTKAA